MNHGQAVMLGIGAVLLGGGGVIVTRPARSESAVYIRRIAGTMALALGLTLCLFALGMARAGGS